MSAVSTIELDTGGPIVDFGETYIDYDFNLRVPFDLDEVAITLSAILETDIGDFVGVIIGNVIRFDIPPLLVPASGNVFVTAKDEVFNINISSIAVTLWVGEEFSSVLEVHFFAYPDTTIEVLEDPNLQMTTLQYPAIANINMIEDPGLSIELTEDTNITLELIEDPDLKTEILIDTTIDTEMM